MQIEERRIEQILMGKYEENIRQEQNPFMINHAMIDVLYPELADLLITKYPTTKETIKRIINNLTLHDTNLTPRFYNIQNKQAIHNIHSQQQGKLVEITGKVIKTTTVFQQITMAAYQCSQCFNISHEVVKHDTKIKKSKQFTCMKCNRKNWQKLNVEHSTFEDIQIITVQENRDDALDGHKPSEIQCILTGDMIQSVKSGDAVILNGLVELRNASERNMFKEFIIVENIQSENEDYEQIQLTQEDIDEILLASKDEHLITNLRESIAPSIFGCNEIKEAVLLQLFGSDRINVQGSLKRGDIHILLVGDAGLGKSQILKFVSDIAPRGIYTSGKSSSGAGLTATATKDVNGVWTLEAGAMVLADKGFLCIDELDKMSDNDRSSMHEALEQQTISVSKAGLNTTLDSRCSVLAAANPKFGSFDQRNTKLSLAQQINLPDTLQSRFDLIFIMLDTMENDNLMLEQMFGISEDKSVYSVDFIRKYISYAKENVHPEFIKESMLLIQKYYLEWRQHQRDTSTSTKVTARQLDALMRLSRASARVRLSDVVEVDDVERAFSLAKYCMNRHETEFVESTHEQVGYKEDVNDKRTYEKLCEDIKRLSDDYENKIPSTVIKRHFKDLDFNWNFIERWLRSMDSDDKMVCDVTTGAWSCVGEWYKD